jgi:hypothetical protein
MWGDLTQPARGLCPPGESLPLKATNQEVTDWEECAILDGVWPCSGNPALLSTFVLCHFHGDWQAHVPFGLWADARLMEDSASVILMGKCFPLLVEKHIAP